MKTENLNKQASLLKKQTRPVFLFGGEERAVSKFLKKRWKTR